jgi:hypothetical protein
MKQRKTDFLHRPPFGWRLIAYPLIVIPWMVYLNVELQEPVFSHRVSSATASLATPAVSTPVQGVNSRGEAYVLERDPKYPVIEFVMILTNERR